MTLIANAPLVSTTGVLPVVTSSGALSVTLTTGGGAGSTSVNILGTQNALVTVATSGTFAGALIVMSTAGAGAGSTAVNIVGSSNAIGPVTSSGGQLFTLAPLTSAVSLSSGTVTLSSAPLVVVATSGGQLTVTTNTTGSLVLSSAGFTQVLFPIMSSAGFGPVTSSAGQLASLSSGTVSLSSQISVTATAATNPWSSAPGFNMPVVSVSSGLVQISGTVVSASSGLVQALTSGTLLVVSASSGLVQALTSGTLLANPTIFTSGATGKYTLATSIHPIKASAAVLFSIIAIPSTAIVSNSFCQIFNATTGNVTLGTTTPILVIPDPAQTDGIVDFGPRGVFFATAASFAWTVSATSSILAASIPTTFVFD